MTHLSTSALPITVLIVTAEGSDESAAGRQVRALAATLRASEMDVVIAASGADARATIGSDASLHAVIMDWDLGAGENHAEAAETLTAIRARNVKVPVSTGLAAWEDWLDSQ